MNETTSNEPKVIKINTDQSLDDLTSKYAKTVLYFTASWCGPCKAISPKFDQLSSEFKEIAFQKN